MYTHIYIYTCIYINKYIHRPLPERERASLHCHPYLPILQTPISHHCNTLQSPVQQIAIYLYCRVQLALLHHLKGAGLFTHSPPQAGQLSGPR